MQILTQRLRDVFTLTADLVQHLSEDNLKLRLGNLPSNTIGQQLWCIIGARESYSRAIVSGQWEGFTCSLRETTSKDLVMESLNRSADKLLEYLGTEELSEKKLKFVISLLEHEVQHHGQLIRYIYGNQLSFPNSWHTRYTV
ncbi:MAG: hypothetical protein FH749_12625 [Firmicutes bacterium]|nr:hypothetical protein [Bacillota bacterium]